VITTGTAGIKTGAAPKACAKRRRIPRNRTVLKANFSPSTSLFIFLKKNIGWLGYIWRGSCELLNFMGSHLLSCQCSNAAPEQEEQEEEVQRLLLRTPNWTLARAGDGFPQYQLDSRSI